MHPLSENIHNGGSVYSSPLPTNVKQRILSKVFRYMLVSLVVIDAGLISLDSMARKLIMYKLEAQSILKAIPCL